MDLLTKNFWKDYILTLTNYYNYNNILNVTYF